MCLQFFAGFPLPGYNWPLSEWGKTVSQPPGGVSGSELGEPALLLPG